MMWMLWIIGAAVLLGVIKRCPVPRHERSSRYRKEWRE